VVELERLGGDVGRERGLRVGQFGQGDGHGSGSWWALET
jgi:hypothetical protein